MVNEAKAIVHNEFVAAFRWMDFNDLEKLWGELKKDIITDIEECADENFNDSDIRIAIARTLFNRLEIE